MIVFFFKTYKLGNYLKRKLLIPIPATTSCEVKNQKIT